MKWRGAVVGGTGCAMSKNSRVENINKGPSGTFENRQTGGVIYHEKLRHKCTIKKGRKGGYG